jgi:hypothetical protein
MKEYFNVKKHKKEDIIKKIINTLKKERGIIFAYLFGSFLDGLSFRDIDIGIYMEKSSPEKTFDYELGLDLKISKACNLPFDIIDVKVLNFAPQPFLNSIFKGGKLLFYRNEELLSDMIENSSLFALANEYISNQSLRELIIK